MQTADHELQEVISSYLCCILQKGFKRGKEEEQHTTVWVV